MRVNAILQGYCQYSDIIITFKELLLRSDIIRLTDNFNDADMAIDISQLNGSTDLVSEVSFSINAAVKIKRHIKQRKRIIKKAIASSRKLVE